MYVLITIDTEAWPRDPDWRATSLRRDIDTDVFGVTREGRFGIEYQMDVMEDNGLKGVFLIEALFALVVGAEPLRRIVEAVQRRGHEVQLHLHPEWLNWMEPSILPGRTGQNMKEFSEEEQTILIRYGLQALAAAGARDLCAFRAGNYGANRATLRALHANGLRYDTSHNAYYLDYDCDVRTESPLDQPRMLEGIWEFPISVFTDWPGHVRHAQLCACSSLELETILLSASEQGWYAFVLVSHSFELIRGRRSGSSARPDQIVIGRFERLCAFLNRHRGRLPTCGFTDLASEQIPHLDCVRPLSSRTRLTAGRFAEQLVRRFL